MIITGNLYNAYTHSRIDPGDLELFDKIRDNRRGIHSASIPKCAFNINLSSGAVRINQPGMNR
jgi:hypothetical protein